MSARTNSRVYLAFTALSLLVAVAYIVERRWGFGALWVVISGIHASTALICRRIAA